MDPIPIEEEFDEENKIKEINIEHDLQFLFNATTTYVEDPNDIDIQNVSIIEEFIKNQRFIIKKV